MPPRENVLFFAGLIAGIFVFAWALDLVPAAEADTHAQAQARQELRIQAAAAQACPKGHAVQWLDGGRMECFKEIAP